MLSAIGVVVARGDIRRMYHEEPGSLLIQQVVVINEAPMETRPFI